MSLISSTSVDLSWYTTDAARSCPNLPLRNHTVLTKGIKDIKTNFHDQNIIDILYDINDHLLLECKSANPQSCRSLLTVLLKAYCLLHKINRDSTGSEFGETSSKQPSPPKEPKSNTSSARHSKSIKKSTSGEKLAVKPTFSIENDKRPEHEDPEMFLTDTYVPSEPTFHPLVRWAIRKALDLLSSSRNTTDPLIKELQQEFDKLNDETRRTISPSLISILCSTQLYRFLTSNILGDGHYSEADVKSFKDQPIRSLIGTDFFDILMHKGYLKAQPHFMESLREMVSDTTPFYESIHSNVITALLRSSFDSFPIDNVVDHLKTVFEGFDSSLMYPYDLEDSMLIWLNQCILYAKRNLGKFAQVALDGSLESLPDVEDLGKDLMDGRVLCLLLMLYFGDKNDTACFAKTLTTGQREQNYKLIDDISTNRLLVVVPWKMCEFVNDKKDACYSSGNSTILTSYLLDVFRQCQGRGAISTPKEGKGCALTPNTEKIHTTTTKSIKKGKAKLREIQSKENLTGVALEAEDNSRIGAQEKPTESALTLEKTITALKSPRTVKLRKYKETISNHLVEPVKPPTPISHDVTQEIPIKGVEPKERNDSAVSIPHQAESDTFSHKPEFECKKDRYNASMEVKSNHSGSETAKQQFELSMDIEEEDVAVIKVNEKFKDLLCCDEESETHQPVCSTSSEDENVSAEDQVDEKPFTGYSWNDKLHPPDDNEDADSIMSNDISNEYVDQQESASRGLNDDDDVADIGLKQIIYKSPDDDFSSDHSVSDVDEGKNNEEWRLNNATDSKTQDDTYKEDQPREENAYCDLKPEVACPIQEEHERSDKEDGFPSPVNTIQKPSSAKRVQSNLNFNGSIESEKYNPALCIPSTEDASISRAAEEHTSDDNTRLSANMIRSEAPQGHSGNTCMLPPIAVQERASSSRTRPRTGLQLYPLPEHTTDDEHESGVKLPPIVNKVAVTADTAEDNWNKIQQSRGFLNTKHEAKNRAEEKVFI